MKSIYNYNLEQLQDYFINNNDKKFHALQVFEWLYKKRVSSFEEMSNIKKETILNLREDFDKKQYEIAELLNITRQQYSLYELGKRDIPAEYIKKLAKYYNTSSDYILEITDEITPYINSKKPKKDIPKS